MSSLLILNGAFFNLFSEDFVVVLVVFFFSRNTVKIFLHLEHRTLEPDFLINFSFNMNFVSQFLHLIIILDILFIQEI